MTDAQFEKFKLKDFCTDNELLELSQEQMEEIANTDSRVKSHGLDKRRATDKARNLRSEAQTRYWKPEEA